VLKKWAEQEASDKQNQQVVGGASNKKRKMITQAAADEDDEVVELDWAFGNRGTAAKEEVSVVRKPRKKAGAGVKGAG